MMLCGYNFDYLIPFSMLVWMVKFGLVAGNYFLSIMWEQYEQSNAVLENNSVLDSLRSQFQQYFILRL